jgi:methylenetetrahydrofolate reductase (NADPH)
MPISSYQGMLRMCSLCGATVPEEVKAAIEPFKDDDQKVQEFGIQYCVQMCKKLIANGVLGLHFYTLNQERSTKKILLGLGLVQEKEIVKPLPWSAVCIVYFNNLCPLQVKR